MRAARREEGHGNHPTATAGKPRERYSAARSAQNERSIMRKSHVTRRQFLTNASIGAAALTTLSRAPTAPRVRAVVSAPALLGGAPLRTKPFPRWPVWEEVDEKA